MIQSCYCATCERHVFAVHVDGETLSDTYARARTVALDAGYRELAPASMRQRPRLLCPRCVAEIAPAAMAWDAGDREETIDRNPKSWAAWKREADRLTGALAARDAEIERLRKAAEDVCRWSATMAAVIPESPDGPFVRLRVALVESAGEAPCVYCGRTGHVGRADAACPSVFETGAVPPLPKP